MEKMKNNTNDRTVSGAARRILIVDDESDVIEFLSYNFRRAGYLVEGAMNGAEGIEKIRAFLPDLIIADIMMPNMDGIIMGKILRSESSGKHLPLIYLSATQDDYQVMNAGLTGDDFVSKPVKFSMLLTMVERRLTGAIHE